MTIRAYHIPQPADTSTLAYYEYVSGLPFVFDEGVDKHLVILPDYVEVSGSVVGFEEIAVQIRPTDVPAEVTMRQARLALLQTGKLALVEQTLESLPEPDKTVTRIWWEYSGMVQRNQPIVIALAALIGLTAADIDNLFRLAITL
jgi:hypothetical protein